MSSGEMVSWWWRCPIESGARATGATGLDKKPIQADEADGLAPAAYRRYVGPGVAWFHVGWFDGIAHLAVVTRSIASGEGSAAIGNGQQRPDQRRGRSRDRGQRSLLGEVSRT